LIIKSQFLFSISPQSSAILSFIIIIIILNPYRNVMVCTEAGKKPFPLWSIAVMNVSHLLLGKTQREKERERERERKRINVREREESHRSKW
jgi:hypothetical protein